MLTCMLYMLQHCTQSLLLTATKSSLCSKMRRMELPVDHKRGHKVLDEVLTLQQDWTDGATCRSEMGTQVYDLDVEGCCAVEFLSVLCPPSLKQDNRVPDLEGQVLHCSSLKVGEFEVMVIAG